MEIPKHHSIVFRRNDADAWCGAAKQCLITLPRALRIEGIRSSLVGTSIKLLIQGGCDAVLCVARSAR